MIFQVGEGWASAIWGETNATGLLLTEHWPKDGEMIVGLCDGYGSRAGMAVETVLQELVPLLEETGYDSVEPHVWLRRAFAALSMLVEQRSTAGTELTFVHLAGTHVVVAHVGAGRAALVGETGFEELVGRASRTHRGLMSGLGNLDRAHVGCEPNIEAVPWISGRPFLLVASQSVWDALGTDLSAALFLESDPTAALTRLIASLPGELPLRGAAFIVSLG